eukprot:NODE_699_length_5074_cov_0.203417.p1 type:complete len:547 gc:universal NODE_699_length_5074_cov_0.203417:3497-1857(-)
MVLLQFHMVDFKSLFQDFLEASDVSDTLSTYQELVKNTKSATYHSLKTEILPFLSFRQSSLFTTLDNIRSQNKEVVYNKKLVISGCGPCGLRAAVQSAMIGFNVTCVELRDTFSRHNVIKTWRCTINDLTSFGLRHYFPSFQPHGHLHLGINQIQMCLLKTALLFNVNFIYNTGVCGVIDAEYTKDNLFHIWTLPSQEARKHLKVVVKQEEMSIQPGESNVEQLQRKNKVDYYETAISSDGAILRQHSDYKSIPFDILMVAEGESSKLIRNLGYDRKISKFGESIGVICNFQFNNTPEEKKLQEYVVTKAAADWRDGPLGILMDLGIDLENLEYMRGFNNHFFVATVKKQTFINYGIFDSVLPTIRDCLEPCNVNVDKLKAFGRDIANAGKVPSSCEFSSKHGIQIFDFSCKGVCVNQMSILEHKNNKSLIFPIGDALQNPFWPQGLGINRGFQSTLDAVYCSQLWAVYRDLDIVQKERNASWKVMDWKTICEGSLQSSNSAVWTADPITRYAHSLYVDIHMFDVVNCESPSLPERVRSALGLKWK